MYNLSYTTNNSCELRHITEQADCYCALPIVSNTLSGVILNSPQFCSRDHFETYCSQIYPIAAKLRHALLFRESLIWLVGSYPKPEFRQGCYDQELRTVLKLA